MKAFLFSIVVALAALSIAAPFWVNHRAQTKLAELEGTISRQAEEISRMTAPAQAVVHETEARLSNDELRELLRLRSEISRLHDPVAEANKLRAAVQPGIRSAVASAPVPSGPDYWPKDQLVSAGQGTPESTLKTAFWAMKNRDMNAMFSCLMPEMRAEAEADLRKEGRSAYLENQFTQMAEAMTSGSSAFRLVDKKTDADGDVSMRISFEGEGVVQDFVMRQVGNEWKIADLGRPNFSNH